MALKLTVTCGPYDRAEVDKMLEYAHLLAITPRKIEPEELFHPSTLET
jgi:hypothetical protein